VSTNQPFYLSFAQLRAVQYKYWTLSGEPLVMWLSGLHIPQSYLTALVQVSLHCRAFADGAPHIHSEKSCHRTTDSTYLGEHSMSSFHLRIACHHHFISLKAPELYDFSECTFPTFQIACRRNAWPLDRSTLFTYVTKFADPDDVEERPVTVSRDNASFLSCCPHDVF